MFYYTNKYRSFSIIIILDENANMLIKLASALLVISICISMAIIFHSLMLNRSLRYKRLYSLILSIRLKDSIKRKNDLYFFDKN